jgi:hypothetical protein
MPAGGVPVAVWRDRFDLEARAARACQKPIVVLTLWAAVDAAA